MRQARGSGWLALALALGAMAAAGADGPAGAWEAFRADLRRGDYHAAYARFSPDSRQVFSRDAFRAQYHPLSAVCEAILAAPEDSRLASTGEWAELALSVRADGLTAVVTASLAHEDDGWYLVAAARETPARVEAEMRLWLRRAAGQAPERRAEWLRDNAGARACLRYFVLQTPPGGFVRAVPRHPGLRTYALAADGSLSTENGARPGPTLPSDPAGRPTRDLAKRPATPGAIGTAPAASLPAPRTPVPAGHAAMR